MKWSDKFIKQFIQIKEDAEKHVQKHALLSNKFKQEALYWKLAIVGCSFLAALIGLFQIPYAELLKDVLLIAVLPATTTLYSWRAPEQKRADHIGAAAQKGAIAGKITKELLLSDENKQDPSSFYDWISEVWSDACGDGPFIG